MPSGPGARGFAQLFDEALAFSLNVMRCHQTRQRLLLTGAGPADWDKLLEKLDGQALELHAIEVKAKVA